MTTYRVSISQHKDDGNIEEISSASGGPVEIAAFMRASAEVLDPSSLTQVWLTPSGAPGPDQP